MRILLVILFAVIAIGSAGFWSAWPVRRQP